MQMLKPVSGQVGGPRPVPQLCCLYLCGRLFLYLLPGLGAPRGQKPCLAVSSLLSVSESILPPPDPDRKQRQVREVTSSA